MDLDLPMKVCVLAMLQGQPCLAEPWCPPPLQAVSCPRVRPLRTAPGPAEPRAVVGHPAAHSPTKALHILSQLVYYLLFTWVPGRPQSAEAFQTSSGSRVLRPWWVSPRSSVDGLGLPGRFCSATLVLRISRNPAYRASRWSLAGELDLPGRSSVNGP